MTRRYPAVSQRARRVGDRSTLSRARHKSAPGVRSVEIRGQPVVDLVSEFDLWAVPAGDSRRFKLSGVAVQHQFAGQMEVPIVNGQVETIE